MVVGICGVGVVGGALKAYLDKRELFTLKLYDIGKGHTDSLHECEVIFICVPVPTVQWSQDLYAIYHCLNMIEQKAKMYESYPIKNCPIFIRSTVLPGTCDQLSREFRRPIYAMPEFLTERQANQDMESLPVVVGVSGDVGTPGLPNMFDEPWARAKHASVLDSIFGAHEKHVMQNAESEMAKYVQNCFGAMKVNFFNSVKERCYQVGLRYEKVREGTLSSGHVHWQHTLVPGPDGKFGYGGRCFLKDMEAFINFNGGTKLGELLKLSHFMNEAFREIRSEDDYLKINMKTPGQAKQAMASQATNAQVYFDGGKQQ